MYQASAIKDNSTQHNSVWVGSNFVTDNRYLQEHKLRVSEYENWAEMIRQESIVQSVVFSSVTEDISFSITKML
jgi:hypothetical protein